MRSRWVVGAISAALAGAAQIACVVLVHDAQPTGPFLVGSANAGAERGWPFAIHEARTEVGYDGQFYLALAIDPFLRSRVSETLDDPGYRARRISWSIAAWLVTLRAPERAPIVLAMLLCLAVAAGSVAVATWASRSGFSALWGVAFALNLGTLVCCWRMLGDAIMVGIMLTAIVAASGSPGGPKGAPILLLAAAVLQKETALLGLPAVWSPRQLASCRLRVAWLVSALVVAAWWTYVWSMTSGAGPFSPRIVLDLPLRGWAESLAASIWSGRGGARVAKDLAFLGLYATSLGLGVVVAAREIAARRKGESHSRVASSIALFSTLGLFLSERVWVEAWAYSRVLLPLAALELLYGVERGDGSRTRLVARAVALAGIALGLAFTSYNAITGTP